MKKLFKNRKQLMNGFRMALIIGIAEFLVMTVLGLLGLWSLVVEIFAIAIMLSLVMLLGLEMRRTSLPTHSAFIMEYGYRFFPLVPVKKEMRVERVQQEDFKPFVFKEHCGDEGYK